MHRPDQFVCSGIESEPLMLDAGEDVPDNFQYTPEYYQEDPRRLRQWKMDSQVRLLRT